MPEIPKTFGCFWQLIIIIFTTIIIIFIIFLFKASGLGKLKPNTLVIGFKSNWMESSPKSIDDYIHTI